MKSKLPWISLNFRDFSETFLVFPQFNLSVKKLLSYFCDFLILMKLPWWSRNFFANLLTFLKFSTLLGYLLAALVFWKLRWRSRDFWEVFGISLKFFKMKLNHSELLLHYWKGLEVIWTSKKYRRTSTMFIDFYWIPRIFLMLSMIEENSEHSWAPVD